MYTLTDKDKNIKLKDYLEENVVSLIMNFQGKLYSKKMRLTPDKLEKDTTRVMWFRKLANCGSRLIKNLKEENE